MNERQHRSWVRPPAVAGTFYPAEPRRLDQEVESYFADAARRLTPTGASPKAVIVPHAGYIYSGPIAASAFAQWRGRTGAIRRVVLIGPSHYIRFGGLAVSTASAWATPLGEVPVDPAGVDQARTLPGVRALDEAHTREHALEVELAFLQRTFEHFSLVPILTGDASPEEVSDLLLALWGGPETAIVVSSDLSHYEDYRTACALDRATADSVENLAPKEIRPHQACGRLAIQGLLLAAAHKNLFASTLDLRNSGDTAGRADRVVGYGAFALAGADSRALGCGKAAHEPNRSSSR